MTPHLTAYQARLRKPLLAHDMAGQRPDRTIPGGTLVEVTENTNHRPGELSVIATVTLDGVLYARDLLPDRSQIDPFTQQVTIPEQRTTMNTATIARPVPRVPNHPLRPVNVTAHQEGREDAAGNGAHNMTAEERAAGIDGR